MGMVDNPCESVCDLPCDEADRGQLPAATWNPSAFSRLNVRCWLRVLPQNPVGHVNAEAGYEVQYEGTYVTYCTYVLTYVCTYVRTYART